MDSRMGFIIATPPRSFAPDLDRSGTADPVLAATADTYATWQRTRLTPWQAALLLSGLIPHELEPGDDDSHVEDCRRLQRQLSLALRRGELAHLTLDSLVAWATDNGLELPRMLDDFVAGRTKVVAPEAATPEPRSARDRRRAATAKIEQTIEDFVSNIESRAEQQGVSFDRRALPGTKAELAEQVNRLLPRGDQRAASTLDKYFGRLGLRWPTNAQRGGLQHLLTQLGIRTGSLGDLAATLNHPT